jgi:hypothetical protein
VDALQKATHRDGSAAEFAEYITFIRANEEELRTPYTDTLGDLALGLSGSVVAAALTAWLLCLDGWLLADRLEDDALAAPAVELGVEDLLPRSQVELAVSDEQDDLVCPQLALQVCIGVVFSIVVPVLVGRLVRRELLEPIIEILDQPPTRRR